jgi:hypothetical protein
MKQKLMKSILGLLAFTFVLTGCSSNEDALASVQSEVNIQNVGGILKFKDQAVFDATVDSLSKMDKNQQIAFLSNYGVKSYKDFYTEANKELDQIIDSASSQADFDARYKSYKAKYQGQFLFNDVNPEYLSPISKLKDSGIQRVVNISGKYMIGNKICKASMYSDMKEYSSEKKAIMFDFKEQLNGMQKTTASKDSNYAYLKTSNRKGIIVFDYSKGQLFVTFTAQKKVFWGWQAYDTLFYLQYSLNKPFCERAIGTPVPANHTIMYSTTTEDNGEKYSLGFFEAETDLSGITGKFTFWTRGIAQTDGITGTIKYN